MNEEKTGLIFIDEATTISRETFKRLIESDLHICGGYAVSLSDGAVTRMAPESMDLTGFEDRYEEIGLPAYHAFGDHYGALVWEEFELRQFCVLRKATWRDSTRLEYRRRYSNDLKQDRSANR